MPQLEVRVLGPLEVLRNGEVVALPGARHRLVLADLGVNVGRRLSTDVLVEHLWAGSPPATATKLVHKYVSEIRKTLDLGVRERLLTDGAGYVLDLAPEHVDAYRFESLVELADELPDAEAIVVLGRAEALWRGAALDGVSDLEFAIALARRWEEARLTASERRLGLLVATGRHAEALPELEQLVVEHPLREELCAQLMLARDAAGRRADALAAYQRLRRRLGDELGIEPALRIKEIEHRILTADLDEPSPAAARSRHGPARVPIPLSSFVGRDERIAGIDQALDESRLVTLTGPGGSGKTRAAIEVVRRAPSREAQAVFVDLSVVVDAARVATVVAVSAGLPEQAGIDSIALLQEALAHHPRMLVLDNCEHVRAGAAHVAGELLAACDPLSILATSREPLGLPGERLWPITPLDLPGSGAAVESEAVRLFEARAADADPGFELDDSNETAVVEICDRLDGMPLAIELAAAHLPALTPAEIADLLDDRFALLAVGGARPPRHATLRATIDWSHHLLDDAERLVFERLSIFPGAFDLAAATAVATIDTIEPPAVAPLLSQLVRRSMVGRLESPDGSSRYRLLDTLRAYGRERLDERADDGMTRAGFIDHVAAVVDVADGRAGFDDTWHLDLVAEHDNIAAALDHAVDDDPPLAARLAFVLERFWTRTDQVSDGLRQVERLLARDDLDDLARARALCTAAELRAEHGEARQAERDASSALELFESLGDEFGSARSSSALGRALGNGGRHEEAVELLRIGRAGLVEVDPQRWAADGQSVGYLHLVRGDDSSAERLFSEVLDWATRRDMGYVTAKSSWLLGVVARHRGDLALARRRCERALEVFTAIDDRSASAHVRMTLGDIARLEDARAVAEELYRDALDVLSDIGDRRCIPSTIKNLADLKRVDTPALAVDLYRQCLDRRYDLGDRPGAAEAMEGLAASLAELDELVDAAALLGCADRLRTETGSRAPAVERAEVVVLHERVAAALGDVRFESEFERGAALSLDRAVALAGRKAVDVTGESSYDRT